MNMGVKKIWCKVRNKLFLNAIRSSVSEIVRKEIEPVTRILSDNLTLQPYRGGATNLIYTNDGSENRR